jgi:hypothetical protein
LKKQFPETLKELIPFFQTKNKIIPHFFEKTFEWTIEEKVQDKIEETVPVQEKVVEKVQEKVVEKVQEKVVEKVQMKVVDKVEEKTTSNEDNTKTKETPSSNILTIKDIRMNLEDKIRRSKPFQIRKTLNALAFKKFQMLRKLYISNPEEYMGKPFIINNESTWGTFQMYLVEDQSFTERRPKEEEGLLIFLHIPTEKSIQVTQDTVHFFEDPQTIFALFAPEKKRANINFFVQFITRDDKPKKTLHDIVTMYEKVLFYSIQFFLY